MSPITLLLSCLLVQAGPPHVVALHAPHLPVWLEQVPEPLHLQVVDPAGLHAVSGGAFRGPGPQAADGAALCGPEPGPHTAGLGADGAGRGEGQPQGHYSLRDGLIMYIYIYICIKKLFFFLWLKTKKQ